MRQHLKFPLIFETLYTVGDKMEKRIKLSIDEILNKQFNIDFKGYAPSEVDEFLDRVIADYQEYDAMIKKLGEHMQEYERQATSYKAKIAKLESVCKQEQSSEKLSSNVDILKRLTQLENEVFKN